MSPRPESIIGYERYDSRGNPTIKVDVVVQGHRVSALVPSGASTGKLEASVVSVEKAKQSIQEIEKNIKGYDVSKQEEIDRAMIELDGTPNKERLGANAILGVSLAVARAAAEVQGVQLFQHIADLSGTKKLSLPVPMMNVINGGVHARNNLTFQEFMIVPVGAKSFTEAMRMGTEVYRALGTLKEISKSSGVGDEGGYAPDIFNPSEGIQNIHKTLRLLQKAILQSGYKLGEGLAIALDPAANEFFRPPFYRLGMESFDSEMLVRIYKDLAGAYPIISIEDGLAEDDDAGWKILTEQLGDKIQLVGDDRFVTNPKVFKVRGIKPSIGNAILIKPNQIGTLTETLQVIRLAKRHSYKTIISHRSGDTEDTFIADLAVGTNAGQIKAGAPSRSERTAKYNRLLDIEQIHLPQLGIGSRS